MTIYRKIVVENKQKIQYQKFQEVEKSCFWYGNAPPQILVRIEVESLLKNGALLSISLSFPKFFFRENYLLASL